jgi:predicted transcriptional regulator
MMVNKKHVGSSLDDFLDEEALFEETQKAAVKRVVSWQIEQEMAKRGITKSEMAVRMGTSRAAVGRLLDPVETGVTIKTLTKAASVVDKVVEIKFVDIPRRREATDKKIQQKHRDVSNAVTRGEKI